MRKFIFSFGVICTVAAAAFLGGCNKNSDCGACCDKEKAAVKTDAEATPAAKSGCAASCADKAKSGCCQKKAACPASGGGAQ